MKDEIGMDEFTEKALQEAFISPSLSVVYRNQLLQDLIAEVSSTINTPRKRFWKKPELWVAVAAVIILAVIGYGIWLPYSVWDRLTS